MATGTCQDEHALYGQSMLALEQPRLALLKRFAREARLLAHLNLVPRYHHCQHRDSLRLGKPDTFIPLVLKIEEEEDAPAPNASAWPAAERQERVARIIAQKSLRPERPRLVPIPRYRRRRAV